jgi:hypothetical protein
VGGGGGGGIAGGNSCGGGIVNGVGAASVAGCDGIRLGMVAPFV